MRKLLCIAALLALAGLAACGREVPAHVTTTEVATTTAVTEISSAEAPTTAAATTTQITTLAATQRMTVAATTAQAKPTSTSAKPSTQPTSAHTTTATQTNPPVPTYTQADYAEIVAAVRTYAESKTTVRFIWDPALTYERAQQGLAGYHDTPNLNQLGKERLIQALKYHCDLTEANVSGANGGVPSNEVHFNIVWLNYQGSTLFLLIYG